MEPQPSARSCSPRRTPCDVTPAAPMNLSVQSTTGTRYELSVPAEETVEGLKRRLAQRLKVPGDRLSLLLRDRRLSSGKLQDSGVTEGSKLTLVPTVEAGLMSQASRPEQSVIQALESLTETQVNDFLSGRSPLTLALRVGDHMMFVQLQLAAQQNGGAHRHVLTSRADGGSAASHYRTLHSGSGFTRVPGPPCPHNPSPTLLATPVHCTATHPTPVTAGIFRSHGAAATAKSSPGVTTFPEKGRSTRCSSTKSKGSSTSSSGGSMGSSSSSMSSRSRKPGAIIESFVNHAPGVFSGTFSGTLHPNCQDSAGRPRRDIGTILQILNDLLSATRHYQGMPQSLMQLRCQTQCTPSSPNPMSDLNTITTSSKASAVQPLQSLVQSQTPTCKPEGDCMRQTENSATRCKVERLQLLMQQKRMRRKARRDARAPYHWLPNRKTTRTNSHSSVSSDGSLDMEEGLWKPEVAAEMQAEFVMA